MENKFKFNDIPSKLKSKLKSDFLAGATVITVSGLLFMGIIQLLIFLAPAS